jgi:DNA-binding protein HU-beta
LRPVSGQNSVGSYRPNRLTPDTLGFLEIFPIPIAPSLGFQVSTQGVFPARTGFINALEAIQPTRGPDMAKKAATPATITLKHLAAALAEEHDLSKKAAEAILTDMVARIAKHLKKGERVRIVGLGILQVRKRAARMGRNPATGEPLPIKASKKVAFRAAKELKEAV